MSDEETSEIREAFKDILGGGISKDTVDYFRKWSAVIIAFFRCVNRENGSYIMMPFAGAPMDQGFITMNVFDMLQGLYIEHLNEEIKKASRK